MEKLKTGGVYTGIVEGYSSEGLGIVRLDGAVVFVPQAVRGETIDLKITKVMKTCAAGEIVKVHKNSPDRAKPECPYFGKCGGCDFQHLTYAEELWAKRQRVRDALTRLGGTDLRVEEIIGAKNPVHYRNKSQYPVGADGSIGFYQARSHRVVPISRCLIQSEVSDRTAKAVGDWMKRYQVSAYDETTGKGLVRHIYVRVNRQGESLCCVVANGRQVPREPELAAYVCAAAPGTVGVVLNTNTRRGNVILGESEAPIHAPDPEMARRRLGFYARNHARTAGYDTDMFGAHYKTLYWADREISDEELMDQHRFVYQNRFSPEKYARYVQIPRDPEAPPILAVPWDE